MAAAGGAEAAAAEDADGAATAEGADGTATGTPDAKEVAAAEEADDAAAGLPAAKEVSVTRSWDCEAVASLLAAAPAGQVDVLDPLGVWGRPPSAKALEASNAPAKAPSWCRGTLVRTVRISVFLGGELAGVCECVVLRRVTPAEHRACRICFEEEGELLDGCACRGTMRFICSECLIMQWAARANTSDAAQALKCSLCHQDFTGKALELLTGKIKGAVQKHEDDFPVPSPAEEEERYKMEIATATQLWKQGSHSEAASLFRKTIPCLERLKGPKDPLVLSAQHNLSLLLTAQGRLEEAKKYIGAARRGFAKLYGAEHPLTLKASHNEAMVAQLGGHLLEARRGYEEVLAVKRRVLGPDNLDTLKTSCNLGLVLLHTSERAGAEELLRLTLQDMERLVGRRHPLALVALQNLSLVLAEREPVPLEAEELAREALDGKQRALGADHPDTLEGRRDLATVLAKSGRGEEAEAALRQALAGMQKALGFSHPTTEKVVQQLLELLTRRGQTDEARELLEEVGRGAPVSGAKEPPAPLPEGCLLVAVLAVYVAPAFRGQGLGRAMLQHCKELASELNAEALEACVPLGAAEARAFLAHCGFTEEAGARDAGADQKPLADGTEAVPAAEISRERARLRLKL